MEDAKEQLAESEEYAASLEQSLESCKQEFDDYRKKRVGFSEMNTGKLVGIAAEYLVKNNPAIAEKIPVIATLSGLMTEDHIENTEKTKASFQKAILDPLESLDEETKTRLQFVLQMEQRFNTEQMEMVGEIIEALIVDPDYISTVHQLLASSITKSNAA